MMNILYSGNLSAQGLLFEIRRVDLFGDLEKIWSWWNAPHVEGKWSLDFRLSSLAGERRPYTLEDLKAYLKKMELAGHLLPGIMRLDGKDIGYTEVYQIGFSPLGSFAPFGPEDRGFHLLIGMPELVGRGVGALIMEHIVRWQFVAYPQALRVGGEPKYDNLAAIKSLLKLPGSFLMGDIELPHKRAALVVIEREAFFSSLRAVPGLGANA